MALDAKVRAFVAWLKDVHGVDLDELGIEVRATETRGLGAFATRRLLPNAILARIPMAAVLHAGKARDSVFGQRVLKILGSAGCSSSTKQEEVAISPEELLWLYMVWGRSNPEACPWGAYLQLLPDEDPLAWRSNEEARRWVIGSPLSAMAAADIEDQQARYETVMGTLSARQPEEFSRQPEDFSEAIICFQDWLWARSCYLSRALGRKAFPADFIGACGSDALCPLLDLLNHGIRAKVKYSVSDSSAELVLPHGAKAYEPGDEVFNVYGHNLGNETLLSRYGFAVSKNPHDRVKEVVFDLPSSSKPTDTQWLVAWFGFSEVEETGDERSKVVRVRLLEGLRHRPAETNPELLRAASVLLLGKDYDQESATCIEKAAACRALARALRGMMRRAVGVAPGAAACKTKLRHKLRRCSVLKRQLKATRKHPTRPLPLPAREPARSAAIYAKSHRRILKDAAAWAQMEAEMAEIAAHIEAQGPGIEDDRGHSEGSTGQLPDWSDGWS